MEVAALTNVTVAPTHRRRGLLTEMITADLRASADRGGARRDPHRLGVPHLRALRLRRRHRGRGVLGGPGIDPLSRAGDAARVELVDLATLRREAPGLYERFRAAQPGSIEQERALVGQGPAPGGGARSEPSPRDTRRCTARPPGQPEGYVRYRAKQSSDHMRQTGELTVDELVAMTPAAYERLWRYCCEVDLVATLRAGDRSVDEALGWLLEDGRTLRQTGRYDFVWVRSSTSSRRCRRRRYAVDGHLVIEVTDSLGFAGGRYALDGGPAGAQCARTDEAADLSMPVDALGSLYAGGVSARMLHDVGRIDEHRAGAVDRADGHVPVLDRTVVLDLVLSRGSPRRAASSPGALVVNIVAVLLRIRR